MDKEGESLVFFFFFLEGWERGGGGVGLAINVISINDLYCWKLLLEFCVE